MLASRSSLLPLGLAVLAACNRVAPAPSPLRVAAAADLAQAFPELGKRFERAHGQPVVFSFGSSGLLAKQLQQGAPFDVFAAADLAFVDDTARAGVCDPATRTPYARGRLAIWSKQGQVSAARSLAELADARFKRIAIANPEHAPYGRAARAARRSAALWQELEPRIVYAENVRQALQIAESGNAEAAIVALPLVVLDHDNPWLMIDDKLHPALDQGLIVCRHGHHPEAGRAFAAYVKSAEGSALMQRYGFLAPGAVTLPAP